MASLRDIFVRLGLKTDPKGFDRANERIQRVKDSAITLGRVLATGAVAIGFREMIGVASDIAETANKFGAVFGDAGDTVQTQLDDIAKRTGSTNLQLQDMASNIGALIKPSLGSAQAAGDMAAQVSELALDISSFNNVTSADALVALRAGLIGSAEPLQQFGVDTRVAAIEQEALRQGITQSYQSMTEGQRIALRFAAIQRQLGAQGATGDATRTAEGFANASRNLVAAIKETAGTIGTFLLGSVGDAVNSMREVVSTVQDWLKANRDLIQQRVNDTIERVVRTIRAVADFTGDVIDGFRAWTSSLTPLGQQILRVTAVVLALVAALMLPGVPILLLIGLVALLIEDFQTWRKGGESVIGDLVAGFRRLADGVGGYFDRAKAWFADHQTGLTYIASLVTALALVIGVKLIAANAAAIASHVALQAVGVATWLALKAAAIASAVATAAAWLVAMAPVVLMAALLTIIVGTIIWLGAELVKLAMGKENFFSTMAKGVSDLIDQFGGIAPAIWEMLQEAVRYWIKFFGGTEQQAQDFVDNAYQTLISLWDNVLEYWSTKLGGWWDKWSDVIDFGFGGDDEEEIDKRARKLFEQSEAGRRARQLATQNAAATQQAAARVVTGPAVGRVAAGGTAGGAGQPIIRNETQNIDVRVAAAPGMDERRLAELTAQEIARQRQAETRQAARSFALEGS